MVVEERQPATEDEAISALIDGELPADDARRLRLRVANESALARRFAVIEEASATVRAAYRDTADVLEAMILVFRNRCSDEVLQHGPRRLTTAEVVLVGDAAANAAPRDIDWAVAALSSDLRRVLCLVNVEELGYREVAEALDVSSTTIARRVARARVAVAERIARARQQS